MKDMPMTPIVRGLEEYVLRQVQEAYTVGKLRKTFRCQQDMAQSGFFESDVEKILLDATSIEKAMPATSERAGNPLNTHYVIRGTSTYGKRVYCKVCSNYLPNSDVFVEWVLTSFKDE